MTRLVDEHATPVHPVRVGSIEIGPGRPLAVIAGPCVLEDRDFTRAHAARLAELCARHEVPWIFKASFDKANRTKGESARGPGLVRGLTLLAEVKREIGVPVLTDVHEARQCAAAGEVADVLQIPAFLCRQTDLLAAAGDTGRPVNIKKGQFLAAEDLEHARDKTGARARVLLTERGTTFGYRDLVVDFRNLGIMRAFAPVVFDGTHSVQSPGNRAGVTGGHRSYVPGLVRAAVAYGVDAVFVEVHPDPDRAPSDAATQIDYATFEQVLRESRQIRDALGSTHGFRERS